MKPRAPFSRALKHRVVVALGIAIVGTIGSVTVLALQDDPTPNTGAIRPLESSAPSTADKMVAAHGCWTQEAPADMAGKVPGHVVVTIDGRAVYGGPQLVADALDQVFNGVDHGMTVIAFCR